MPEDLQTATAAVDHAWQAWKQNPTPAKEAAYHRAHDQWKALGGDRGVGRPASGDTVALTSSERSQAARHRQAQSATRWEKVAPIIQMLRRALEAGDKPAVISIAENLVKETEKLLSNLHVIHAQPDDDFVVLNGFDGAKMVLAFIPVVHLDDLFRVRHLSGKQANVLVDANLEAFARIISNKYERGEHRPYSRFGSTLPRVDLTLEEMEQSGETFSKTVLDTLAGSGWIDRDGSFQTDNRR